MNVFGLHLRKLDASDFLFKFKKIIFEIVKCHEDEKTKYVNEVAVIKSIKDGREARMSSREYKIFIIMRQKQPIKINRLLFLCQFKCCFM